MRDIALQHVQCRLPQITIDLGMCHLCEPDCVINQTMDRFGSMRCEGVLFKSQQRMSNEQRAEKLEVYRRWKKEVCQDLLYDFSVKLHRPYSIFFFCKSTCHCDRFPIIGLSSNSISKHIIALCPKSYIVCKISKGSSILSILSYQHNGQGCSQNKISWVLTFRELY